MTTYLDKFCKNLSTIARPLRDLLKQDSQWIWDEQQRAAWNKLKKAFQDLPSLTLFNPDIPLVVSVDASPTGLGAVLLQNERPIAFWSVSLTDTQKRYVQLEKELLAVQCGLDRFHQYTYGKKVIVETDHKPLVGLMSKPIAASSTRVQRIRLQLQRHNFQLVYKPGRYLYIADALSRTPRPILYTEDQSQHSDEQVHAVIASLIPAQDTRKRFVEATSMDPTLQLVIKLLQKGWPEHKASCPVPAKQFLNIRNELTCEEGILLRGEAIVVPVVLRQNVLKQIHHGHFGEIKCINRAKSAVYWPGYIEQIKNLVASCNKCQKNRSQNPAQPWYPVDLPEHPFQKVGCDLFEFNGVQHLLVVDYHSKWPCAVPLKTMSSSSVIAEMDRIFSDFGAPSTLI